MATKKVEEKKKETKKKDKVVEAKVVCDKCNKEYLATLDRCPKCGYSEKDKKSFYEDESNEDFEEYDDEDEVVVEKPKKEKKQEKTKEKTKEKVLDKKEEKAMKKELKKEKKYKVDTFYEQNEDLFSLIKIIIAVVLLVGVVYLVVAFINGDMKKDEGKEEEKPVVEIQNEKILGSSIFTKADKEYFVLVYDGSSVWADFYVMMYENYKSVENEDKLPMYWVDLSDGLNADIVAKPEEESNPQATKYSELRIKTPTLIRVKEGKIRRYYEGERVETKIAELIEEYSKTE